MNSLLITLFAVLCAAIATNAQNNQQQYTTPIPILKQINRQNEDGSYSFGYEAADKSFKIETKYPNGEVYGKYGYVDDTGKVREVEYGASQRGFEPQGSDINVPPPTLNNDNNRNPLGPNEQDDGQYREDPSIYYKSDKFNTLPVKTTNTQPQHRLNSAPRPQYQTNYVEPEPARFQSKFKLQPTYQQEPQQYYQPQQQQYQQQQQQQQPQYQEYDEPQYKPQFKLQPQHQQPQYQQPQYQQRQYQQPQTGNQFQGHPAEHIDINTGSYSLSYTG